MTEILKKITVEMFFGERMRNRSNYGLFIKGEWVDSVSGKTFQSDNPAKPKQILGVFQKGNTEDVANAVAAAEATFESWSETPAPKRGVYPVEGCPVAGRKQGEVGERNDDGDGQSHK